MLREFQLGDKVIEKATGRLWIVIDEYENGELLCEKADDNQRWERWFWPVDVLIAPMS